MNFKISHLPEREIKPRQFGLTMVMDKGMSIAEAENLIEACGNLIDFVKLGFGTSLITNRLAEKIRLYKKSGINIYFGGTLFEAFLIRNNIEDYIAICRSYNLEYVEISNGSINMPHEIKLEIISDFSQYFTVISEVGSKFDEIQFSNEEWLRRIERELESGSTYVITEGRESGTVGIYNKEGKPKEDLIQLIASNSNKDKIIWEAPIKSQQVWFIKQFGANVNLGNIDPNDVISLETLRLGLRGDTFFDFLPEDVATSFKF